MSGPLSGLLSGYLSADHSHNPLIRSIAGDTSGRIDRIENPVRDIMSESSEVADSARGDLTQIREEDANKEGEGKQSDSSEGENAGGETLNETAMQSLSAQVGLLSHHLEDLLKGQERIEARLDVHSEHIQAILGTLSNLGSATAKFTDKLAGVDQLLTDMTDIKQTVSNLRSEVQQIPRFIKDSTTYLGRVMATSGQTSSGLAPSMETVPMVVESSGGPMMPTFGRGTHTVSYYARQLRPKYGKTPALMMQHAQALAGIDESQAIIKLQDLLK
ncbi:ORF2 [Tacheng Tick Virus 6]|uniref:ORF2 n=1 Tax=Tacheng Tick Virus 6 TaxID=1608088 RepID=A0A0B5KK53_9MONO|nr:ORF2 [Tacheng Tick Virus 6]AJG39140.1 ORF2 [Tacheng Tick Virus 6]